MTKRSDRMGKVTQEGLILKYLHDFGFITSWQAFKDLGITRLSARIWDLKDKGYIFKKERVETRNRYNQPCHYEKYILVGNINDDILDKAKLQA